MINTEWLDTHRWMIRASDNGVSHGGFRWKPLGQWTECPDWNDTPSCGGGLHGVTPERNGFMPAGSLLELCEIGGPVVPLGNKIKTSRARIVATGPSIPAEAMRRCGYVAMWDGDYLPTVTDGMRVLVYGDAVIGRVVDGHVRAYESSSLTIEGDVTGGYVWSRNSSSLTIEGDVTGGNVWAYDSSSLTIEGSVTGGNVWAYDSSSLTIEGDVTDDGHVWAYDSSALTIEGDVPGGYVWACDSSALTIEGSVTGGDVMACCASASLAI